jgi:hypothetical protein
MNALVRLAGFAIALCLTVSLFAQDRAEQCTSAVISPAASATGGAVLWKNRDAGVLSNKVVHVAETPHSYLALVNFDAASGRQAFAGLNSAGFAIMNTVAYNLPAKSGEMKDLEGVIMADALRTCATVEDFEALLQANLGPDLGALTNFGVIDAAGRAVIFEAHNHGFETIDAAEAPEKYLVNTNFARSGEEGDGAGYLRFDRATELFRGLPPGPVDPFTILTRFSRDTGHSLLRHPAQSEWKNHPPTPELWIHTRHTIDRPDTSAAVVILGRNPDDPASVATMWVIPGEPLAAVAVPLWVEAGRSPEALWKGERSALWQESKRIRNMIRPLAESEKKEYLLVSKLDNSSGTGYLPKLLETEAAIIRETKTFLSKPRTPAELGDFQDRTAARALEAMKRVNQTP